MYHTGLFSFTCNMGFPFWLYQMCFLYRLGSNLTISSAIVPYNSICTLSSLSACKKAPGKSIMIMYLPSFAPIVHDNIIVCSDTIGKLCLLLCIHTGVFHQHICMPLLNHCAFPLKTQGTFLSCSFLCFFHDYLISFYPRASI